MANYEVTKDATATKIKTVVREDTINNLISALGSIYGEDRVGMIRTGKVGTEKNEIGVQVGTVLVDGVEVPVCITINVSAKDFVERKTQKNCYEAFDFLEARERYENYLDEKNEKEATKEKLKKDKIAKDKARRGE